MKPHVTIVLLFILMAGFVNGQGNPYYKGGMKITFDKDPNKYIRFIAWTQFQLNMDDAPAADESLVSMQLRRARFLAYGELSEKFLVVTHFGLNSLNADGMSPTGQAASSQLFMHDAWIQYEVHDNHVVGGGLHYWNGISRLNRQGTLNLLTLDNYRPSFTNLGLSDQFQRHLGVFAKGNFGQFQYQLSVNEAITNSLDTRDVMLNQTVYQGKKEFGSREAGRTFSGYFVYNFFDLESNFLPYSVGTYLGDKRLLNVGAGFFAHPNGVVRIDNNFDTIGEDVSHFALDVFYDQPLGDNNASITAYGLLQHNNYGTDYNFGPYASGLMYYGHVGYLIPGNKNKARIQPYVSVGNQAMDYNGLNRTTFGGGMNLFFIGHNAKLTLEYQNTTLGTTSDHQLNLQAMIYL